MVFQIGKVYERWQTAASTVMVPKLWTLYRCTSDILSMGGVAFRAGDVVVAIERPSFEQFRYKFLGVPSGKIKVLMVFEGELTEIDSAP